jgi:adsorption protein B
MIFERNFYMIYYVGLIFITVFIILSFDDLVWDIITIFKKKKIKEQNISYEVLEKEIPGFMAIVVAAYKEEAVLERVILNFINSVEYPNIMYDVFLGVYPNDYPTLNIAQKLNSQYENVHVVTHYLNGPSSKADNINNIINYLLEYEKEKKVRFKGIVVHDSEDVIHPYELLVENHLFNTYKAIQIPVFPFQYKPKINNIFKNMVLGTYADEFAENHYNMLVTRNILNTFVPSAGTGFAIRRDVLELFPNGNIFTVGCLTEDYKLSLDLKRKNIHVYYFLDYVERLRTDGILIREFIATRSIFPSSYRAAVKQKTRWIYGITMQSFKLIDIIKDGNLSIPTKFSLYKDWKAKISNLLILPGYMIFVYFLLSFILPIPVMFPTNSLSWYFSVLLTILMLERQFFRFRSVHRVYGIRSAFISSFFPPILPLRMVVGNIINFHATINSWRKYFNEKYIKIKKPATKPKWDKTEHEFLDNNVLINFKRRLGDILLEKNLITADQLKNALNEAKKRDKKLGEILLEKNLISEKDLLLSLAQINNMVYAEITPEMILIDQNMLYHIDFFVDNLIAPIIYNDNIFIFATSQIEEDISLIEKIRAELSISQTVKFIYTSKENLLKGFNIISDKKNNEAIIDKYKYREIEHLRTLVRENKIDIYVSALALKYVSEKTDVNEILSRMGFLN